MFCPSCNSENVKIESVQENLGSTEFSRTKTKEKRHGFFCKRHIFARRDICRQM